MKDKKGAPHTVTVDANSALVKVEKPSEKVVQGTATTKGPSALPPPFKWTKRKKKILKGIISGKSVAELSAEHGVHRNTIMKWRSRPEWIDALNKRLVEMQTSSKLKRVTITSAVTDRLASKAAKLLNTDADKLDVSRTGLVLREYREFQRTERDLYGENGDGADAQRGVTIIVGGQGANGARDVEPEEMGTARLAFEDFMSKYNPELGVMASSPQEAAALIGEKVLQETALIDTIREEDRAALRKEAEEDAERKNK